MLNFKKPLKIYLFKDRLTVNFNIRVSDSSVNTYEINASDFENLLEHWQDQDGIEFRIDDNDWHVQWKKRGPRPQCEVVDYVKISVSVNTGQTFHYRVDFLDMHQMQQEYFYQKNNKMYWD